MASIEFQGVWFDPDNMHQRLLGEIERQKKIYAELLAQGQERMLEYLELEKRCIAAESDRDAWERRARDLESLCADRL